MARDVLIVDYGVGNLLSVRRAFEHCGAQVNLSGDPKDLAQASRVVLPGVGAFGDCVNALRERGLDEAVVRYVETDKPLLGICVGMQMLFDASEEFGQHQGLGIIPGIVRAIPNTDSKGQPLKIPHIGWSTLELPKDMDDNSWADTILADINPGTATYFVHSFTAQPVDQNHRLADAIYKDRLISAVVHKEAVYGTQFHPEKSGPTGLTIIKQFLRG